MASALTGRCFFFATSQKKKMKTSMKASHNSYPLQNTFFSSPMGTLADPHFENRATIITNTRWGSFRKRCAP